MDEKLEELLKNEIKRRESLINELSAQQEEVEKAMDKLAEEVLGYKNSIRDLERNKNHLRSALIILRNEEGEDG